MQHRRVSVIQSNSRYPEAVHVRLVNSKAGRTDQQLMDATGWSIFTVIAFERRACSDRKMRRLARQYAKAIGLHLLVGKVDGYYAYVIWNTKEQS